MFDISLGVRATTINATIYADCALLIGHTHALMASWCWRVKTTAMQDKWGGWK